MLRGTVDDFLGIAPSLYVAHNALCFAIRDRFPVSLGHTPVITRRRVATWFDATADEGDPAGAGQFEDAVLTHQRDEGFHLRLGAAHFDQHQFVAFGGLVDHRFDFVGLGRIRAKCSDFTAPCFKQLDRHVSQTANPNHTDFVDGQGVVLEEWTKHSNPPAQ